MPEAQSGGDRETPLVEKLLAASLGFAFLGVLAYAGLRDRPIKDPGQLLLLRVVASISAAACAAIIPGFLDVKFRNWVRAGGAIAVFVIIWFTNPPAVVAPKEAPETHGAVGHYGHFAFECGDIDSVPFGAAVSLPNGEHRLKAYGTSITLTAVQQLEWLHGAKSRRYSAVSSIEFSPAGSNPRSAFSTEPYTSPTEIRFERGASLRAHRCEGGYPNCAAFEVQGPSSVTYSSAEIRAELNRYSTSLDGFPQESEAVTLVARSSPIAFVSIQGNTASTVNVWSIWNAYHEVPLALHDPVLSDSTMFTVKNCRSISGNGIDGKEFLSIRPTPSPISFDTSSSTVRISDVTISCTNECIFRISAEGAIAELRQNNTTLWPLNS